MLRGRRYKDTQLQVLHRFLYYGKFINSIVVLIFASLFSLKQITWFVQNSQPPKIANEDDLLEDIAVDENMPAEIRLEDEEEDEEAEDRSWRR